MIKMKPYMPGDVFLVNPRKEFGDVDFSQENFLAMHQNTYAHSIWLDEKIIGVIAISLLWNGVAECWTVLSEDVKCASLGFHKLVLRAIKFYEQALGVSRIQSFVKSDFDASKKWLKSLGYTYEGTLKKWSRKGEDYEIWARVK